MKIVKIILVMMLLVMVCPLTMAEENDGCQVVTYYSRKEWVTYYDFFDTDFNDATEVTNSRMISANLNGFGPYSFERTGAGIYPVSYENISGMRPLVVTGENEHDEYFSTFMITFGAPIRISDMDVGAVIRDANGNITDYDIYAESGNGRELVYEGHDEGIINLDLGDREVREIYIRARYPSKDNTYELKYFMINQYQIYEHVSWTSEYIENTETDTKTYCSGDGEFEPYEGIQYQKSYLVGFTPSIKLVDDSIDYQLVDSWMRYNDGLKIGIAKGSLPDYANMYLWNGADRKLTSTFGIAPSTKNFTWKVSGNHYTGISKATGSSYIETSKVISNRKVYFKVDADAIRCVGGNCAWYYLGGGKYDGHSSNKQDNAYDTYVKTYTKEPADTFNYISQVVYYLLDVNGNRLEEIKTDVYNGTDSLEDMPMIYEINRSGIYMIEAVIKNALNDTVSVKSGQFHVDIEGPKIYYSPEENTESKNSLEVLVKVDDEHSGVDKWRYRISNDNGVTYGTYSEWSSDYYRYITINDAGMNVIAVEAIDKAGNTSSSVSPVYKINSSKPVIYARENYYFRNEEVSSLMLIENASAFDEMDGDISEKIIVRSIEYPDGRIEEYPSSLDTSEIMNVYVTFEVKNSFDTGNTKRKEYRIIDSESYVIESEDIMIYNRYISEDYLGSLKDNSIWRINDEYHRKLLDTLEKSEVRYRYVIE